MENLELALEDCLQRLAAGTSNLDQCLALYPQHATELQPLLQTSLHLQQGRQVQPSAQLRDRMRAKVTQHVRLHPRRRWRPLLRLTVGAAALAMALFFITSGIAQAALPGQGLYPWKLSTEQAWRAASPDPISVDLSLADRRTDELLVMASDKQHNVRDEVAESAGIAAYTDVLNRLSVEWDAGKNTQVLSRLQKHQEQLSAAGIHVPELDEIVSHGKSQEDHGKNPTESPQP